MASSNRVRTGPVDAALVKRLQRHNKKYQLGLTIDDWPTRLEAPKDITGDDWYAVNQEISRLHREDQLHLDAIFDIYEERIAELERAQATSNSTADLRQKLAPGVHLALLERLFEVSPYSSKRYKDEPTDVLRPGLEESRDLNPQEPHYPDLSVQVEDAMTRSDPVHRFVVYSDDEAGQLAVNEEAQLGRQLQDPQMDQLLGEERLSPEERPRGVKRHLSSALQEERVSKSRRSSSDDDELHPSHRLEVLPGTDRFMRPIASQQHTTSANQSRNTSFTSQFTSSMRTRPPIETPATSFGSVVPGDAMHGTVHKGIAISGLQSDIQREIQQAQDLSRSDRILKEIPVPLLISQSAPASNSVHHAISREPQRIERPKDSRTASFSEITAPGEDPYTDLENWERENRTAMVLDPVLPNEAGCQTREQRGDGLGRELGGLVGHESSFRESSQRSNGVWNQLSSQTTQISSQESSQPKASKISTGLEKLAFDNQQSPFKGVADRDKVYEDISPSGTLEVSYLSDTGRLRGDFKESEPKYESKTHRLGRKFGHDRFLVLDVNLKKIPRKRPVRFDYFTDWLFQATHRLWKRAWRAFFIKGPQKIDADVLQYQVFLFATDGDDFKKHGVLLSDMKYGIREPLRIKVMTDWMLNLEKNKKSKSLKLFSRIGLGLTRTNPSVVFCPSQIVRTRDAFACCAGKRSFETDRHGVPSKHIHDDKTAVMNDGCGRISYAAALEIVKILKIDYLPSAFQGRIAGAKGVWFVDRIGEMCDDEENPHIWIEITDSQHKFDAIEDNHYLEDHHLTFEVHSYSHPLVPNTLNFNLFPILEDRSVPRRLFGKLLEEDFDRQKSDIAIAMDEGGAMILSWLQSNRPTTVRRLADRAVKMAGGFPADATEGMIQLAETGHCPKQGYFRELCKNAITDYFKHFEKKPAIGLPRSTSVVMVADPTDTLNEGEIFLQFSSPFEVPGSAGNPNSNEKFQLFDQVDVLVARQPVYRSTDVQKVQAVYRTELQAFHDVVVFSSKGDRSLAELLSGGDYDGDKAWVCWDPRLVIPFQNAVFEKSIEPGKFGITQEQTLTEKFLERKKGTSSFLFKALKFNMQPSMLGTCANWYEGHCYAAGNINECNAVGSLLGHLVDTAKNGFTFNDELWSEYLKDQVWKLNYPPPAWKRTGARKNDARRGNSGDYLFFWKAPSLRQAAETELLRHLGDSYNWDPDLGRMHEWEKDKAKEEKAKNTSSTLHSALVQLENDLNDLWKAECERLDKFRRERDRDKEVFSRAPLVRAEQKEPLSIAAGRARQNFLSISPPPSKHPLVQRWGREAEDKDPAASTAGSWTLLKASALASVLSRSSGSHSSKNRFLYSVAGIELCEIKARIPPRCESCKKPPGSKAPYEDCATCVSLALDFKGTRPVRRDVHVAYKIDQRYIRRSRELPDTILDDEENEDVMSQLDIADPA